MIDEYFGVKRYLAEYSEETEWLIARYDLETFELPAFQKEFGEANPKNPMFDCYAVAENNISFLERYLGEKPKWNFNERSYFVEAHSVYKAE
ncbi:DUF7683 domain-containing protein [Teredinibacter turnerae]|uniref:DUF7683 domain-containing protein n=1 Tax=Teredinibacter turnerae TaxID=2426 RepID=UPI0030CBD014